MSKAKPLLLPFAQSIYAKSMALRTLELSPSQRARFLESISDDIKKCSNFLQPEVSKAALAKAVKLNVDLYSKSWHDQPKFDGSHQKGKFHLEHLHPVSTIRDLCSKAMSRDAVLRILLGKLRVAWILKTERRKLDRTHRSNRPDPDLACLENDIQLIRLNG